MNKCPISQFCGGCTYQGIPYEKQLQIKQESVEKLLSSFGKVEKILPCREPLHYRNKAQFSFGYDDRRRIIGGYYMPDSHRIVEVDDCMIAHEGISRIYRSIFQIVVRNHISIYDECSSKGCLRHVLIRANHLDQYMVVFITGSHTLHKADLLVKETIRYNPQVVSIIHNVNPKRTSMVLGNRNEVLYGKRTIMDELCSLSFSISASSFYQVNRFQTLVLYETAIRNADLQADQILIDAYCGTGTIGLCAAKHVKKVYGVESNPMAIKDAEYNRKLNSISNIEFVCEDAGKYMEKLFAAHRKADVLIMDPPRGGSDQRFLSSAVKLSPEKIIYISCNPVTLKRDLNYLKKYYEVTLIQPVDMFPYTSHIETVCCLYHQKKDFISVPYEPKNVE